MPNVSMLGQGQPGNVTPPMFSPNASAGGGMPPAGAGSPGAGLNLQSMIALLGALNRRPGATPTAPTGGAQPQQGGLMSLLSGTKHGGGGGGTPPMSNIQTP